MAGGAGVSDSLVSKGSDVAVWVKVNLGSAPSLMSVTSWVAALGLESATRVCVRSGINVS